MSLFQNTSALGITPDDIGGCPLGALGVPEFGTDFAMQMLLDTSQSISLTWCRRCRSGTWYGRLAGKCPDVDQEGKSYYSDSDLYPRWYYDHLIAREWNRGLSFTIMESVRKGKGSPEWKEDMKAHVVCLTGTSGPVKRSVHVPSTCGSLCYDGVAYCLL